MYAYSSLVLAAFVLLAHLVVGAPPACLLAALGAQPNPSNVKALCNSGYLEGNITSMCSGSDEVNAMSAYSSACSADGVTVSISSTGASSATTTTTTVRSSTSVTTVASSTVTIVAPIASTIVAGPSSTSSTAQSSSGSESHSAVNSTQSTAAVKTGTVPVATTTSSHTSQTSPISAAVLHASFSSIAFRLIATLSLAALAF